MKTRITRLPLHDDARELLAVTKVRTGLDMQALAGAAVILVAMHKETLYDEWIAITNQVALSQPPSPDYSKRAKRKRTK